jgi:hypothetical protein
MRRGLSLILVVLQLLLPPGVCYCHFQHGPEQVAEETACCHSEAECCMEGFTVSEPDEQPAGPLGHVCRALESGQTWRARPSFQVKVQQTDWMPVWGLPPIQPRPVDEWPVIETEWLMPRVPIFVLHCALTL